MNERTMRVLCAKEALKKWYDGTFKEMTIAQFYTPSGFNHVLLDITASRKDKEVDVLSFWKNTYETNFFGSLAMAYMKIHGIDPLSLGKLSGSITWWSNENIENLLLVKGVLTSSWDCFKQFYGMSPPDSGPTEKVSRAKEKTRLILEDLIKNNGTHVSTYNIIAQNQI